MYTRKSKHAHAVYAVLILVSRSHIFFSWLHTNANQIEKLRESVQTLCRSANPLAKMVDYVQEDMDSMQKELESWRKANQKYATSLQLEEE